MNYYEWLGELDSAEINFPDLEFNGFWMVEGKPVIGWTDYMIAVYMCAATPRFEFGMALNSWPIFSPAMQALMERLTPGVIQFLPFRFQRLNGKDQVAGYCVGQILRVVDCLDRQRTSVRNNWEPINAGGDFGVMRPFALSRSGIGDEKLFRIQGKRGTIVIREDVRHAIESAGFSGQRFDLIECSG